MSDPTDDTVSDATRATEASEEHQQAQADRPPTPDEEAAAEENDLDPSVGEHYKREAERGADVEGEGQID